MISFKFFLGGLETKGGKHLALLDPEKKIYLFPLVSFSVANPCISIQGTSCSGLKNGTVKILSLVGAYQSMVAEFHGVGDAGGPFQQAGAQWCCWPCTKGQAEGTLGFTRHRTWQWATKAASRKILAEWLFPTGKKALCLGVSGFCCRD